MTTSLAKDKEFILDFLNASKYFFKETESNESVKIHDLNQTDSLSVDNLAFCKIEKITYEENAPRKEALENVLSNMRLEGVNVLFLVVGNNTEVSFYYGLSKDTIQPSINSEITIDNINKKILQPSIEGNFRGSRIHNLSKDEIKDLSDSLNHLKCMSCIQGVPGILEDKEKYQSIDRLVDVMKGENFAYLVTAKYLPNNIIYFLEDNIYKFYEKLLPHSKKGLQTSEGTSTTKVESKSSGTNTTNGTNSSTAKTSNSGFTIQDTRTTPDDDNEKRSSSKTKIDASKAYSVQNQDGTSFSKTEVNSNNEGTNSTESTNKTYTYEFCTKKAQEFLKFMDDIVLKRLDYGKGKGLFISNISIFADNKLTLRKLGNTVESIFSGDNANKVPLMKKVLPNNKENAEKLIRNFQIPILEFEKDFSHNEKLIRTALSQYSNHKKLYFGNWYSVGELGLIVGLPQKEVIGLQLKEEVEFGLNFKKIPAEYRLELGNLVQSGVELEAKKISLDLRDLNKHVFVTGVTGSGKTTTCQKLIIESNLPFLVIEPAKTEYRILNKQYKDLLIFTLGRDDLAPFRINPLEFFSHESITSHIDMVKASIESAFDMDAAIPQIIEKAIYECYEECGWDLTTKKNKYYADPYADGIYSFPTFNDLIKKTKDVVNSQGFDQRLKDEYIGSINARLQGLTVGAKGQMLCCQRSMNFSELIHRKVILELEDIRSGTEKALIMGFVVSNLIEAIKAEFFKNSSFKHITLIEEAHRLLSAYSPGDSLSKKNAVEIFSDMLAEVRKYGESLIIADQIPSKLTSDVLKNTNTKIIHKIFAQDDKDAVGNTIALKDEQKKYLSFLDIGRAVVFSQGWEDSMQVKITEKSNTTESTNLEEQEREIKQKAIQYYCSNYKKGFIKNLKYLQKEPNIEEYNYITNDLSLLLKDFRDLYIKYMGIQKISNSTTQNKIKEKLLKLKEVGFDIDMCALFIFDEFYFENEEKNRIKFIKELLNNFLNDNFDISIFNDKLFDFRRK